MNHDFSAKILVDSISPDGVRLTTMEWTFPRYILAEVNTHRMKSSNAASSRAIPYSKQRANVVDFPWVPDMEKNQPGMQSTIPLSDDEYLGARLTWLNAMLDAVKAGDILTNTKPKAIYTPLVASIERAKWWMGRLWNEKKYVRFPDERGYAELALDVHKQFASRLLEPFMWTTIIISATDWNNLFALRCHPAAEPSFQKIAGLAYDALQNSIPQQLAFGDWHLPLANDSESAQESVRYYKEYYEGKDSGWHAPSPMTILRQISVGRCARVSYLNHEGKRSIEDDIALHDKLSSSRPGHWSAFEHAATPAKPEDMTYKISQLEIDYDYTPNGLNEITRGSILPKVGEIGYCGNFRGWKQYRKMFEAENVTEFSR